MVTLTDDFFHKRLVISLAYLVCITCAELLTTRSPKYGIAFHGLIIFALFIHSSLTGDRAFSEWLIVLIIAPLIRILSFSTPSTQFSYFAWFLIISLPIYIAIFTCIRIQNINLKDIGLVLPKLKFLPIEIAIIFLAFPLGLMEYYLLKPGIVVEFSFEAMIVPSLIMIVATGFLEELSFRGLLQYHATKTMGFYGIIFISALFGLMHIGNLSFSDVFFAVGVGFIYSMVVRKTGSIYGVTISHGMINIMLFLIAPHYF